MLRLADINIRPKIITAFLITGIIPLVITGFFGSRIVEKTLLEKSFSQLSTVQELRRSELQNIFSQRAASAKMITSHPGTQELIKSLNKNFPDRPSGNTDPSAMLVAKHMAYLSQFVQSGGYQDLIFIDAATSKVLISIKGSTPGGDKLSQSKYRDTGLAEVFERVVESQDGVVVDFEPYPVLENMEIGFYGLPVMDARDNFIAVLVILLPSDFLSKVIESRKGMGNTGESYIVSWDDRDKRFELVSNLQTMGEGKYVTGYFLDKSLPYWDDAVKFGEAGNSGTYLDSAGNAVLVAYNKLKVAGVDWFLISKIDQYEVNEPVRKVIYTVILVTIILALLIGVTAFLFASQITRPIIEDAQFAMAISEGKLDKTLSLDQKDELGRLAKALNQMSKNLYEIDWLKNGKEQLNDITRGENDIRALMTNFIRFVVKHLDAQIGAVYANDEGILKLYASYAFSDRQGNFNQIKIGEGLIGQAALENATIIFNDVEEDAPAINYGSGERTALSYMIVPVAYEDTLLGVFLVGSIKRFNDLQLKFIDQNRESIAVTIHSARSRKMIDHLYQKAREHQEELLSKNEELEKQTKALKESEAELQAQQEELRVTNEELEEQTKALKESEAELQAQQEELRVTNEELESHSQALSKQKEEMVDRNKDLEKAHEMIQEKAKALELSSKYKSEFLANMSHELRTPLNSILILSQIFANNRDGNLNEKQIQSAGAIHSSGKDLLTLINEILDLSKVESGKIQLLPEEVEIKSIVENLIRIFKDVSSEKQVAFNIQVEENLSESIYTDHQRLQQILRNLLTNAFKFTKDGEVRLKISRPSAELISGTELSAEESIAFAVKDDGIGIPTEQQPIIFEAFQQADGSTSRKYGGTGLGLSISRELSKLLGGTIHLQSREGIGSTFTVVIPERYEGVAQEAPPQTPVKSAPDEKKPDVSKEEQAEQPVHKNDFVKDDRKRLKRGDKILLIIEDDYGSAKIMRDFARERGFKCIVAEDGETGIHFADYYHPSAIILDIGLPGMDGWSVMERLKNNSQLSHIPVHFMSAADSELDAMQMGAIGFLSKPISIEKVDEAFGKIEHVISRPVRNLLIVEDDPNQTESIKALIGNGDVHIANADTGEKAFQMLSEDWYDCMILDLGLQDMSGFELLEKIYQSEAHARTPVIVYTGRDLSLEEDKKLRKYTESIIIKGVKSPERLLEESALFLHRVEAGLPTEKQKMLKMTHDRETLLEGKTALLVDDDMRNVFALSSVLEEKAMNIIVARDGIEGVDKCKKYKEIDIVLMDIMMPNMDGYEAIKEIRRDVRNRKLPIIALTAKAMKGDRNKCIQAGANDYLAKPVDIEKLISMLRVWLY